MKKISIVLVFILIAWFVPIVPTISWRISGIPTCRTLATRTLKSAIFNRTDYVNFYKTDPVIVVSWGICYYT